MANKYWRRENIQEEINLVVVLFHTLSCQYFGAKDLHRDTENYTESEKTLQITRVYHENLPRCCGWV